MEEGDEKGWIGKIKTDAEESSEVQRHKKRRKERSENGEATNSP
jgi:hypothetical protein